MHHSQRAARSFVRGLEIRLKTYMPKKVPNTQRIINNVILKIVNIVFSGGRAVAFPAPPPPTAVRPWVSCFYFISSVLATLLLATRTCVQSRTHLRWLKVSRTHLALLGEFGKLPATLSASNPGLTSLQVCLL